MMTRSRWLRAMSASTALSTVLFAGCQTWVPEAGITLPAGTYLRHPPQYIPRSPDFPLTKELASQEEAAARLNQPALLP